MYANYAPNAYASASASSSYQSVDVATASPARLIAMLFGALEARLTVAEKLAGEKDGALDSVIDRALAIVTELQNCLDMGQGGELASNLHGLYTYIGGRLRQRTDRAAAVAEVRGLVSPLADAWKELSNQPSLESKPMATRLVA